MKLFASKTQQAKSTGPNFDKDVFGCFANLPSAYKDAAKKDLKKDKYLARLKKFHDSPLRLLEEASQILAGLNRLHIKAEIRIELLNAIIPYVYPELAMWYAKYQNVENSLPESNERRTALGRCVTVAEQLSIAYKHLFVAEYSSSAAQYKKAHSALHQSGLRILEMLRLVQRFKALRYQKLSRTDWLDCNQVFFSMVLHSDVDESLPLSGNIGFYEKTQTKNKTTVVPCSSIRNLFISIQLFGVLDASTWPSRFFHLPDAYLGFLDEALKITSDNALPLEPGWLLTYLNNEGPPLFERQDNIVSPVIRIDFTRLYKILVADHELIARMKFIDEYDVTKLSKPLQSLREVDRVPALEAVLQTLKHMKRSQKRHPVHNDEALQVYFGNQEVIRLLRDITDPDLQRALDSRKFIDTLAQQSAGITGDQENYLMPRWSIVNFSAGGLLISTAETSFSRPINIGQLMAFLPANTDLKKPTLGYINRLNRTEEQRVEVAIVRLSNHVEMVIIQDEKDLQEHSGHPAILIQDLYGHWQLIVSPKFELRSGDPLKLIRHHKDVLPVRLGDIWVSKNEFNIYLLRSPGLK